MGAWDAGSIVASLTVNTAQASADLDKIEARVRALESTPHVIRVSAVFEDASLAKARAAFSTLDNQISRDALQRLRTSPYGSVLGTLDALFSPHPLAGGPSAQQSASRGLLGQMLGQQATTGVAGTQPGTSRVSGQTLGSVVTGAATGATQSGTERVTVTGAGASQAAGDLETAAADGKAAAAATGGAAADTRDAASDLKDAANALRSAAAAWAIGGLQKLLSGPGSTPAAAPVTVPVAGGTAGTDAATTAVEQLDAQVKKASADYETLLGDMGDQRQPAILSAIPQLEQLEQLITQITASMSGPGEAGAEAIAAFQAQLRTAATALDAFQQQEAALDKLAGGQAGNLTVNVAGVASATQQVSGLQKALTGVGAASSPAAAGLQKVGSAAAGASSDASHASGAFGLLGKQVQLWAGAFGSTELIGQVQLWHILLDGIIESSVIVVETTLTMAETIVKTLPIWEQLYTNIKSTDEVAKTFGMSLGPVHIGLTQLQKDLQPGVLELYGGALQLIGKQSSVASQGIQMVVNGFDTWIAKLDLFMKAQGQTGGMLVSGYNIMKQLAVILDTVGEAFDNLLKADPGTVHYLLDVVEAGTQLVKLFSEIPAPILKTVIGIHGFLLWGGLLTDLLVKMVSPIGTLGSDLVMLAGKAGLFGKAFEDTSGGLLSFLQNIGVFGEKVQAAKIPVEDLRTQVDDVGESSERPGGLISALTGAIGVWGVGIGAAAIALGGLVYWMTTADTATHALISTLQQGVNSDSASTAILAINASIEQLDTAITQVGPHVQDLNEQANRVSTSLGKSVEAAITGVPEMLSTWGAFGKEVGNVGDAIVNGAKLIGSWFGLVHGYLSQGSDISAFKGAIVSLTGAQDNLFKETGGLVKQGYSYSQALALMDLAGVSAGDSFAVMQQKVANLIKGYQEMSVQGGVLSGAVDAVTFASEQQKSAVSDITAGWSAFLGVVTGGATAFDTFEQGMNTLVSDAGAAGASMTGVGTAAVKLKSSLSTVSNASLTLQSQFQSQLTNAEAVQAALLNQASAAGLGAKGTAMLTQAGKDLVAQLIPVAGQSKEATAELYAFAQLAGYQGPDSLKALNQWLGNTEDSAQNLDTIVSALTVDSSNLTTDMNNLATALQQNLNTAMSAAIVQADGGQKAFDAFANAAVKSHDNLDQMRSSAQSLATELITTLGNTRQAESEFIVFAEKLGLTQKQAISLWDSLNKLTSGTPYAVSLKETGAGTFTITGTGSGAISSSVPGAPGTHLVGKAAGGMVTGGSGPTADDVPIMASGGEYVVQASSVAKYGTSMMNAINAGSFASGGLVPSYSGTIGGLAGATTTDWNDFASTMTSAMEAAMTSATKSAQSAANAAISATAGPGGGSAAQNQALARQLMPSWASGAMWSAWQSLWNRESGWNQYAYNASSGATGIPQALPYTKMPRAAWLPSQGGQANPHAQETWGIGYIQGRYGNPQAAWGHETAQGWYALGGPVGGGWFPGWLGGLQGLSGMMSGASGGSTGTAYVGNYTGVVSPASGGFGITAQQLGLPPASSSSSTSTASSAGTGTGTSASTSTSTSTAAKKTAKTALNAAQKAAISVLEGLMGGLIWHNQLGQAKQANALLDGLGVSKYNSQLSQIANYDNLLLSYRKKGNKTAEAAAEKILTSFGVHVFNPALTATGNAPKVAVVKKLTSLLKADITAGNITTMDQANTLLRGYGVTRYTSQLQQIRNLESLLSKFEKAKNSGEVKATETLLRQLGVKHFAQGGTVWEPVVGFGTRSGGAYMFAEHGPETVTPGASGGGGDMVSELRALRGQMDKLINTTAAVPAKTGEHVGAAFGGVGRSASFGRRYHQ